MVFNFLSHPSLAGGRMERLRWDHAAMKVVRIHTRYGDRHRVDKEVGKDLGSEGTHHRFRILPSANGRLDSEVKA